MNKLGVIFTIFIYASAFMILILNNFTAKKEDIFIQNEKITIQSNKDLLEYILGSLDRVCKTEYNTLLRVFEDAKSIDSQVFKANFFSNPSEQISVILDQVTECLCNMTNLKQKNIIATLAYSFGEHNIWCWLDTAKVDNCCLTLEQLMTNSETTFYQVYSGSRSFVFYNNKVSAEQDGHYVMSGKDKSNSKRGSILCVETVVGVSDKTYVRSILTISTYGKQFVEDKDEAVINVVEENIKNIILPEFQQRLQIELALLYLKYIIDTKTIIQTSHTALSLAQKKS